MHPDRPHDARIRHKNNLELTIPLVDCPDHARNVEGTGVTNEESPVWVVAYPFT